MLTLADVPGYSDHKVAQAEQTCAFGVSIFAP